MPERVRQLILFGAPLLVGVINSFHPVHADVSGAYRALQPHVTWWTALHLINLGAFALLGLATFLLVRDASGPAAALSRSCAALYVPLYVGLDTLAGIGTGVLIQYAQGLPPDQLGTIENAIDVLWAGEITLSLGILGSFAWAIAMFSAAIALTEPKRKAAMAALSVIAFALLGWGVSTSSFETWPWWTAVGLVGLAGLAVSRLRGPGALLILSGVLFGTAHVPPLGPLGMLCFLGAATWLALGAGGDERSAMSPPPT